MKFNKITEQSSNYNDLENKSINEIISIINKEDKTVADAVEEKLDDIVKLIESIEDKVKNGGRLFYIGAGTSGRLGILDASECPPTFGVSDNLVIGIIAGGDKAIRKSQEFAEDNLTQGWYDLKKYNINQNDSVIGIAASGTTPYVVSTIKKCNSEGILTSCITCNPNTPLSKVSKIPIEIIVGPEFVTGSTRMKSGTAQKLVLNMISTTLMIRLGKVLDNKMVDMKLSNSKLVKRAEKILVNELKITKKEAQVLIDNKKSVRYFLDNFKK